MELVDGLALEAVASATASSSATAATATAVGLALVMPLGSGYDGVAQHELGHGLQTCRITLLLAGTCQPRPRVHGVEEGPQDPQYDGDEGVGDVLDGSRYASSLALNEYLRERRIGTGVIVALGGELVDVVRNGSRVCARYQGQSCLIGIYVDFPVVHVDNKDHGRA